MLLRQELILLRHAQSTANATGVWQGQLDFPLSEKGRWQARFCGEALASTPLDAFYASPLSRAYETAEIIARQTGFAGKVLAETGLMERAGGMLEGTTREERESRDPGLMQKLASLPEEEHWTVVGAETDEEVLKRFTGTMAAIRTRHGAGSRIVVVSHGGALRAFLRDLLGPEVLPDSQRARNASITRLTWKPDGSDPRLEELASTAHLPEEAAVTKE